MTAPDLSRQVEINGEKIRVYDNPASGKSVPSITTVISMLAKPGIAYGGYKVCGQFAAENLDTLAALRKDPSAIVDLVRFAPSRAWEGSSVRGDLVHDWIERRIKSGGEEPRDDEIGEADYRVRGTWESFKAVEAEYNIEWTHSETTVWSDTHEYAGTLDFMARINGQVILGDFKCMVPETRVTMADGTEKPAGSIHHGDLVASWDGEKVISSRVTGSGDNGIHPVIRVTTLCGRSLTVTEEHPVLTETGWRKAADLAEGDYVQVAAPTPGDAPDDDPDLAYFAGLVLGDGGLTHGGVRITNVDERVIEFLGRYASTRGMRLARDGITYSLCSDTGRNPVTRQFRDMGLMGVRSGSKFIPQRLMAGTKAEHLHLVAGYLDSDGSIRTASQGGWNVSWVTKSEMMARQFQSILTGLGVRSRVNRITSSYRGGPYYYWKLSVGDRANVIALQSILPVRGTRSRKLHEAVMVQPSLKMKRHMTACDLDKVIRVERLAASPTVWIEVAGTHTHITEGIVSHNTGKSIWPEVGLQLAALANADYAFDDRGGRFDLPKAEEYRCLHLRPRYGRLQPVDGVDECFEGFLGLRAALTWKVLHSGEVLVRHAPKIEAKSYKVNAHEREQ